MNEWSSKEFFTGSVLADQSSWTGTYRRNSNEVWSQEERVYGYTENMFNGYRSKEYQKPTNFLGQPFAGDDRILPSSFSKKKKNGASDPRFKRVINLEAEKTETADTEKEKNLRIGKSIKEQINEEGIPESPGFNEHSMRKDFSYQKDTYRGDFFQVPIKETCEEDLSHIVTKDTGLESAPLSFNESLNKTAKCDSVVSRQGSYIQPLPNVRRSVSDCTLLTKRNFGDWEGDENLQRIRTHPSSTRLSKVQNWMREHRGPAEKKRSVITVIGQTQSKPFSVTLNEINQRRKLAKELDKHALCEAIETAEKTSGVKNVIAKVDFVLPDGKVIYSAEKIYVCKNASKNKVNHEIEGKNFKSLETLTSSEKLHKRFEMVPEKDTSPYVFNGKRFKSKRLAKKLGRYSEEKNASKGNVNSVDVGFLPSLFWQVLLLLCVTLCVSALYYSMKPTFYYTISRYFKPKTEAWYKKILY